MPHPEPTSPPADTRLRCPRCGTEQERPRHGGPAVCVLCRTPLGGEERAAAPAGRAAPSAADPTAKLAAAARAELAKEQARMTGAVYDAETEAAYQASRRAVTAGGLLPFVGPWIVRRSEYHTAGERQAITAVSALLSAAIVAFLVSLLPGEAERLAELHGRIAGQTAELRLLVEEYHSQRGLLPDAETWERSTKQADLRFYDPWGRPYLFRPETDSAYAIGTLGADGIEGGKGEDADRWTAFPAPPPVPTAVPAP